MGSSVPDVFLARLKLAACVLASIFCLFFGMMIWSGILGTPPSYIQGGDEKGVYDSVMREASIFRNTLRNTSYYVHYLAHHWRLGFLVKCLLAEVYCEKLLSGLKTSSSASVFDL
jgi:hypothetical protein